MYKRIRSLREDKDLTQRQLADYLNITQATYSRYESGNLDVPSLVLIKLSNYYNVSIDYILGQTDNPKRT
ncbi:helix-turn-helix domain-containing protein [Paenibacillus bouchesdurhonensis]|uniref:helix-turn-helix domain-containing protein n=1 Tax=Paenibacillus bouchesdurhonensis TaxID=1870990 RepID=UPI000DA5EFCA|nr:helix-turn-helix transcriptional regulator [Paenibacillus bouchesdurhonensis]